MKFHRIYAVFLRQIYLLRGSLTRFVPIFVWVTIDIVVWGFMTRYLNSITSSGVDFVPALLGAVLLWGFFVRVMQGVTMPLFEDAWSRNFLNIFASPITLGEYVAGLVLSAIFTGLMGLVVLLLVSTLVFHFSVFAYGLWILPFLLLLFLSGIALGIFGCAIVLRYGPSGEWLVWPLTAIISPFAAVFYPVSTLPKWMQDVSYILPPSYVFEGIRGVLAQGTGSGWMLFAGGVLAIGYIVLASGVFLRVYRHAVRTGLIARYTAESAN